MKFSNARAQADWIVAQRNAGVSVELLAKILRTTPKAVYNLEGKRRQRIARESIEEFILARLGLTRQEVQRLTGSEVTRGLDSCSRPS